jgi:prepilin-type N-terminal cleavage/methylation domain-containing protein/prepilin-type processing-associated H-X9-DG protein
MKHRTCQTRAIAFTLLELLVVIAVVAVVASMLLPAISKGKAKARSTQCMSNLRQWGLAIRAYADDNDDVLPHRGQGVQVLTRIDRPEDWFNALPFYFGSKSFQELVSCGQAPKQKASSIFICPDAIDLGSNYFLAYAMNMNLSPWSLPHPTRFRDIVQPSQVVAMADGPGPYSATYPSANPYSPMPRHGQRANLLFLGGQVKAYEGKYIGCGVGDPGHEDVRWLTGTDSDAGAGKY